MTDHTSPRHSTDLRERRRRATRTEIAEAALTLFEERGLAATTVHDIAVAAGVSDRTCFRYLTSKEESVLIGFAEFDEAIDRWLQDVTPEVPALTQLEAVYLGVLEAFDGPLADVAEQQLRVRRLMSVEPTLRASAVSLDAKRSWERAPQIAAAFGDTLTSVEARLMFEYAGVALRQAFDTWAEAKDSGREASLTAFYNSTLIELAAIAATSQAAENPGMNTR